ncbi:MAG: hypothetical protein JST61_08070 [Acidobacteria bacterium]|nr:hypothetical protein [Acidobacteriota bacterium]
MGTLPANDYTAIDTTNLGSDFASGYRVQTTAGSTYAQCKVAAGFVAAIAIKGK